MASQMIQANREGVEVYHGVALCTKKSAELLVETNMPLGLLPLTDMEEVSYNHGTDFVWLRHKKGLTHTFKQIGRQVSYTTEVTTFVQDRRMKCMLGVKTKEILIWILLSDMFIDKVDHSKITFKMPTSLGRTYPVSAFGKEDDSKGKAPATAAAANGKDAAAVAEK